MNKPRKKPTPTIRQLDHLKHLNLHAAGFDSGASEIYACVPADQDAPSVRVFQTVSVALEAWADWRAACGVTTGAMASTGLSWIPVDEIVEARGVAGPVIHARPWKHVPGRQTDV